MAGKGTIPVEGALHIYSILHIYSGKFRDLHKNLDKIIYLPAHLITSKHYPLIVSIWAILAIFADFAFTANAYFKYGHSYFTFLELNPIVVGLTYQGILPFLMEALIIASLSIPLAFSNSIMLRLAPLYLLAIPHTLGALSWIFYQPFIVSYILCGFFMLWGLGSMSRLDESHLNKEGLVFLFYTERGHKMSNGGNGTIILLLIGGVVGLFIGYILWDTDSAKLDSITNTLDAMSNVEIVGTSGSGSLQIKYPLLIHSEHGSETILKQSVFNIGNQRQDIRVHLQIDRGSIPSSTVRFEDWSANTPAAETTIHESRFISPTKGYGYIGIYLNENRVGEIIFISE